MKRGIVLTVGLLLGGAAAVSLLAARASGGDKFQYRVARIPATAVEVEINVDWHVKQNSPKTVVTPLDYFGKDGWELVSTVREPDGSYVCFFKAPK